MNNQKEDTMSYGITGLLVMFWPIFLILYSCNIPYNNTFGMV